MTNSVVILNAADIPAAQQIVAGLPEGRLLVFDPALLDRAATARAAPVDLVQWTDGMPYRQWSEQAHALSRELGAALDAAAEPLWPGLAIGSWQHLGLYYLHMGMTWHTAMFEALAPRLAGHTLHVPLCDNAQTYYFPSFLPALLLLQRAQRSGLTFKAFNHGRKPDEPQLVPALHAAPEVGGRPWLLTHLPTCFYDVPYINAEIQASGKAVVDLRARYWHVPVAADAQIGTAPATELHGALDEDTHARIEAVVQALRDPLETHLSRWITAVSYRVRQADQMLATTRAQLLTLALLHKHLDAAPPARLLLSDHDTDFHGPLAAFARARQVPMVVLPHSKASTDMDFVARDATVLYHAIQGDTVYDVAGHRPAQFVADFNTQVRMDMQAPGPVRRVGLLLNGVGINGVPGVDWQHYVPGIRRIVQWAAEQGVELVVRSRPGGTLFNTLIPQAGLTTAQMNASAQGTMAEFTERCDLCLMYDAPTSGALEFLSRGIPILNPVVSTLTKRETGSMNAAIIPRQDLEVSLRYAADLIRDPQELQRFRLQQFLNFADRYRESRALRAFL